MRTVLVVAVVVAAAVGAVLWRVVGSGGGWDPQVAAIARFVENDRGLSFEHPVPVHFLSTAQFRAQIGAGDQLSSSDRAALEQQVSELRALGLAHGPVNLADLETKADQADTVGYYDSDTKQLYVEGTTLTPYVRVTVAHELTHALQDQRLGLSRLDGLPDDEQAAISALVEGDATTVEQDYRSHLTRSEEAAYEAEESSIGGGSSPDLPEAVADSNDFPYDFGPAFVDSLLAAGGNGQVDAAFARPPTAEAQIVNPSRYLAHTPTARVAPPAVSPGGRRLQPPAAFGQVSMAETLGASIGWAAWAAVQGWQGDSAVLYQAAGRTCVAIGTLLDSPVSSSAFLQAARQWATGLPGATVTAAGNTVEIRSCDPGPQATIAQPASPTVHDVLVARADLIDAVMPGDVTSAARAECTADATIKALGTTRAVAYDQTLSGAPSDTEVQALEHAAEKTCPAR